MRPHGELALVLHTHMPYVEGFGTWPFGEEWLWEAIAGCYVPLLDVLGRAPITLSLTPVLCDQLEAPGAIQRCLEFLREIRPESHRRDAVHYRREGQPGLVAEVRALGGRVRGRGRSAGRAARRPARRPGRARQLDVVGDPRGAAAAGHRGGRRAAGADRAGLASPPVRGLGRRLLAARVRVRAVARLRARGGRRARHLRRADRGVRSRRRPAPAADRHRRGTGAVAA